MKKPTTKSYALRIDGPLVKPMQELKKRNRRSLNAEINAALEAWVAGDQRQTATPEAAAATGSAKVTQSVVAPKPEVAPKPARAKKQAKRKTSDAEAEPPAVAGPPAVAEPAAASATNA